MTLAQVIALINQWIVANGDNEITADVLRPILLSISQQPNDLIGDLEDLTTDSQTNLVEAINELNQSIQEVSGITIFSGANTPITTPPVGFTTGDFYAQVSGLSTISFWQFNGTQWVEIRELIDDDNTTSNTTWSSEKIQQILNEKDAILSIGNMVVSQNDVTIPANAVWRISGVTYTNASQVILPINPATTGYFRTDIIVANSSNTFEIIEGNEGTSNVIASQVPAGKVFVREINIFGSSVIDGGSGEQLVNAMGWFDYNDLATHTTPLDVVANTELILTNDALGENTNLTNAPFNVFSVWDADKFNFNQLGIGDVLKLRVDLNLTTDANNAHYKLVLRLAEGTAGEFDLQIGTGSFKNTVSNENICNEISFYIGNNLVKENAGRIILISDTNGEVSVNGWFIEILRKGVNVFNVDVNDSYLKKKSENLGYGDPALSGSNAVIQLRPEGNSYYAFSNAGLVSIDGFGLDLITGNPNADAPYPGKDLIIANTGTTPFSLLHDGAGTAVAKFFFLDEQDLIVPAGGKVWLKYGNPYCEVIFKSWSDSSSTKELRTFYTVWNMASANTWKGWNFNQNMMVSDAGNSYGTGTQPNKIGTWFADSARFSLNGYSKLKKLNFHNHRGGTINEIQIYIVVADYVTYRGNETNGVIVINELINVTSGSTLKNDFTIAEHSLNENSIMHIFYRRTGGATNNIEAVQLIFEFE